MKTAIVWFKNDLRLHDNATLAKAIEENDRIIPFFCLDERLYIKNKYGLKRISYFRNKFLFESLIDLDQQLRKAGSGLLFAKGKPEIAVVEVAKAYHASSVYAMQETGYEELASQALVEKELRSVNCRFVTQETNTLYTTHDLPFSISKLPDVFTEFRKKIESNDVPIKAIVEQPTHIVSPTIPELILPDLHELDLAPLPSDSRAVLKFYGGEKAALERLNYYFAGSHAVATYKETRNELIGESYSSKFSPWLALGCLSPRLIMQQLKKYESEFTSNESTYWLYFELLWRDYFVFAFKKYPYQFFTIQGIKNKTYNKNIFDEKLFHQWINGETNSDFINANMIELKQTGFMSNRGRQNAASYFCHELQLDWRIGASYFEEQLIDYDVCSNWGNWAYIAGAGNSPGKERIFNIEKQAAIYDADGSYRKLWLSRKM